MLFAHMPRSSVRVVALSNSSENFTRGLLPINVTSISIFSLTLHLSS